MNEKPLRKELRTNAQFNPFNDKYDFNRIKAFLNEKHNIETIDIENEKLIFTALNTKIFREICIQSFKHFENLIQQSKMDFEGILSLLISIGNREYLHIAKAMNTKLSMSTEFHLTDILSTEIKSLDKSIGTINAISSTEAIVDTLNATLNYLKYFNTTLVKSNILESDSIKFILRLFVSGNVFSGIKEAYDDCIWNNGFIENNEDLTQLKIKFFEDRILKLQHIGFFRFQRNTFGFLLFYDKIKENLDSIYSHSKLKVKITDAYYINDSIEYELCEGIDNDEKEWEIDKFSEFVAFYPFMTNVNFPKDKNLNLFKVFLLFNLIQHLIKKIIKIDTNVEGTMDLSYFNKFLFRIKKKNLLKYLEDRSKIPSKSILTFLFYIENIVNNNSRINFWEKPLVIYKNCYYFPLTSILHPINTYLADYWLESGGFDLKDRGKYLEKYLRSELRKELTEKNYTFDIPIKSKFNVNNKYEEIDFILNLKKIIVLAEVKCIKYPLTPRDYHNSEKTLFNAALQIERKEKFFKDNSYHFRNDIIGIEKKKIVKLIITNYPLFTGVHFNGVPVVDLFLIESYFKSGKISNVRLTYDKNEIAKEELTEIVFYNNENEFNDNFESHMFYPAAIKQLEEEVHIQDIKISPESFEPEIFKSVPKFKNHMNEHFHDIEKNK